jgi:hypothetical protein
MLRSLRTEMIFACKHLVAVVDTDRREMALFLLMEPISLCHKQSDWVV